MELIMQSFQLPATSSLLGPNILPSTLLSNTLNLCSPLSVIQELSHPYKTTGKIIACIFIIFKILKRRREDKRF